MANTIPIQQAVKLALEQHQAGNFSRAEVLYVEILRQDPGNADAIHLLGVLARQGGNPAAAVQLIQRAISRRNDVGIIHYNLAEALAELGRVDESIDAYRRAIELDPAHVASYANLSILLINRKQFADAEKVCREGLNIQPDMPALLNNLGVVVRDDGRFEEALDCFERATIAQPNFAEAMTNLAMSLCAAGRLDEGIATFREVIRLRPTLADAHNNLGTALVHQKKFDEAIACFENAIDLDESHHEAVNNLASALRVRGKVDQAISMFKKAIELKSDFVEAHANLAASLSQINRHEPALEAVDRAISIQPRSAKLHQLRGIILRQLYRHDEAMESIRKAIELDPNVGDAQTALGYSLLERGELDEAMNALLKGFDGTADPSSHSNVLMTAHYHPGFSPKQLYDMHRRWSELHEAPQRVHRKPHINDRSPDRKLRVGYVSPDFRGHSVAYFLTPILEHHDRSRFEVYAYAQVANFDMNTYRMRTLIDQWRETADKDVDAVERMIRDDQIDILVDCAGHTGGNLLPVFARKPAAVQINMIGFPSTTGLSSMDYRITDTLCDPPGLSDETNSETLIRMPHIFWTYQPPPNDIAVGPLPADENGYVTFTSVNNFAKVTPQMQAIWARLLLEIPESRLIIQTSAMNSESAQDRVRDRFAAAGADIARLEFRPWSNIEQYLRLLERSDITLDPYPFNGGTTTCHSLWMGAPVLTLAGDRHASRMGLSILTNVGLPEFIAHTPEQYVQIAKAMAKDLARLRTIRASMREKLLASPMLDSRGYTADLEAKYREMWARWCTAGV